MNKIYITRIQGQTIEINKMVEPKGHWIALHVETGQDIGHGVTKQGCLADAINTLKMHGVIK